MFIMYLNVAYLFDDVFDIFQLFLQCFHLEYYIYECWLWPKQL